MPCVGAGRWVMLVGGDGQIFTAGPMLAYDGDFSDSHTASHPNMINEYDYTTMRSKEISALWTSHVLCICREVSYLRPLLGERDQCDNKATIQEIRLRGNYA